MTTTKATATPAPATELTITREGVYEEEIAPLVERLARLCKKHDVPLLVVAQTDGRTDADEDTLVITARLPGTSSPHLLHAYAVLPRDAHEATTTKTIAGKVAAVETHE